MELDKLTELVIGCAYNVSNNLGSGFLEKVYENAMKFDLENLNVKVKQQEAIKVYYKNQIVGEYFADLLVEDCLIVELKTVKTFDNIHIAQILNYLKATRNKIGLLINFYNPKVEIKRIVNDL